MNPEETPRQRLARLMDDRRGELRLHWREVAERAGMTTEGLRYLRDGKGRTIRSTTRRGIEDALFWEPGAVAKILAGGDPAPRVTAEPSHRELIDDLRAKLDELRAVMDRELDSDGRPVRNALIDGLRAEVERSTTNRVDR